MITEPHGAQGEARTGEARARELELQHTRRLAEIGKLAAGVAHEINTPMQYIGDNLSFLDVSIKRLLELAGSLEQLVQSCRAGTPTPRELERCEQELSKSRLAFLREQAPLAIEQSLAGVDQVSGIVQALKEFSHPGGDEQVSVDLNQLARSVSMVTRNAWRYHADLSLELSEDLPAVKGNPQALAQVLINLVVNAADAIESCPGARDPEHRGKIVIRSRAQRGAVELELTDDGCGIPEAIQEQVMQPFFTTKVPGKGTGQGLALARSIIVDQHGGKFSFRSEPGQGTSFFIQLPLRAEPQ